MNIAATGSIRWSSRWRGLFAVEVGFHTEMGNPIHLVLRTRPDIIAADWDEEDVACRWLIIAKLKRNGNDTMVEPTPAEIARELNKPGVSGAS